MVVAQLSGRKLQSTPSGEEPNCETHEKYIFIAIFSSETFAKPKTTAVRAAIRRTEATVSNKTVWREIWTNAVGGLACGHPGSTDSRIIAQTKIETMSSPVGFSTFSAPSDDSKVEVRRSSQVSREKRWTQAEIFTDMTDNAIIHRNRAVSKPNSNSRWYSK